MNLRPHLAIASLTTSHNNDATVDSMMSSTTSTATILSHLNNQVSNIIASLLLLREDAATPFTFRKSMELKQRSVTKDRVPSLYETLRMHGTLVLTNWSTLFQYIMIPNCNLLYHYPLLLEESVIVHSAVIFRIHPDQEELGIMTCTHATIN
jgi:hypothetical protein